MFIQKIQKFKYYFISFLALMPLLALAEEKPANLAEVSGLEEASKGTALIKDITLQVLVANIINGLLSVLGLVFMVLIIWGGFKWMTSQGNAEQVSGAKEIIKNSTIGLAIVLASYGIVMFIFDVLLDATGA